MKDAHLEKSNEILADVEGDGDEAVQQEEVVEELHHEVHAEVLIVLQHLVRSGGR